MQDNQTSPDFFANDLFIQWRISRTPELDAYWSDYLREHPEQADELKSAAEKLDRIRINQFELGTKKYDALLDSIIHSVKTTRRRKRLIRLTLAAASILILFSVLFALNSRLSGSIESYESMIIAQPMPPEDIRFISGDQIVALQSDADFTISDAGVVSITQADGTAIRELEKEAAIVQNKLIVPRGKRSRLMLPDGSKVWLNAGTELEFPSRFDAEFREISVIGEIYVEVAPDDKRPFRVHTQDFEVKVHGTSFNVSSYESEPESSVVLVSGQIELIHNGDSRRVLPGEKLSVSGEDVSQKRVETDLYTGWINGILKLQRTPVSEILEKVGRYYNVHFQDNHSSLMSQTCSGTLVFAEDVEDVIRSLCMISGAGFERMGDTIYITGKS